MFLEFAGGPPDPHGLDDEVTLSMDFSIFGVICPASSNSRRMSGELPSVYLSPFFGKTAYSMIEGKKAVNIINCIINSGSVMKLDGATEEAVKSGK